MGFFRIKKKDHSKGASRSKGKKAKSNNTGNTIDEERLSGHMKQCNPQNNITTPKVEGNAKDKPTKAQISKASREEKVLQIPQSSMYKGTDSSEDLSSDEDDLAASVNSLKTVKSHLGSDQEDVSPSGDVKPPKPTYSSADTGVSDQEQKDHIGQGQLKDDHQGKRVKSKKRKARNSSYVSSSQKRKIIQRRLSQRVRKPC